MRTKLIDYRRRLKELESSKHEIHDLKLVGVWLDGDLNLSTAEDIILELRGFEGRVWVFYSCI